MKASEVYREAARLMETLAEQVTYDSCCWAIALTKTPDLMVLDDKNDEHCKKMKEMFAPQYEGAYWMNGIGSENVERHDGRILALCFMAAIFEDEERTAK